MLKKKDLKIKNLQDCKDYHEGESIAKNKAIDNLYTIVDGLKNHGSGYQKKIKILEKFLKKKFKEDEQKQENLRKSSKAPSD